MKQLIFITLFFSLTIGVWGNEVKEFNTKTYREYPSFGSGKEIVYVYYYDTYRYVGEKIDKLAKSTPIIQDIERLGYFPCKVGKTINLFNRLKQQNASMPEAPIIPFVIKTPWATELEILLHLELYEKTKNRKWITEIGGGGKEWFLTTPQEIYSIADQHGQISGSIKSKLDRLGSHYGSRVNIIGDDEDAQIYKKTRHGQQIQFLENQRKGTVDPKYEDSYRAAREETEDFIQGLEGKKAGRNSRKGV